MGTQEESPIFAATRLSKNDREKITQITDNLVMLPNQKIAIKQTQQILTVSVPELGTVYLKNKKSYSGKLTAFNTQSLTLSEDGFSQSFLLKDIEKVDFSLETVWIETEEEIRRRLPIRGVAIPIDKIPLTGLKLENSLITATVNLSHLTSTQFDKLTKDPDKVKVINTIIFEGDKTLTIKIVNSK